MLTVDIDSDNMLLYVYVVNIDRPGRQRNPAWVNRAAGRQLEEESMHRATHSHPRRALVASGLFLIALAASGGSAQAQSARLAPTDGYSAFVAGFSGLDGAGRDMVWRGAVAGAAVGRLTLRLAPEGEVVDPMEPMLAVEGIVFVSGEDPRRAFAAEVRGTIDRQAKRVTLDGVVSTGYLSGARIELTADIIDDKLHGELRLGPARLALGQ
jgi:hypothetical protein